MIKKCFIYGTAQFKLVCFVAPLKYFPKLCMSVDNCTRILHAIHAHVTSPYIFAYIRAYTHVTMHAC